MTFATHSVAPEEIMAFLDGELSAVEAQTMSAHLKDCAQCALVAEQFRATSEMLSRWEVEAVPAVLEESVKKFSAKAATHRAAVKSSRSGFRGRALLLLGSGTVGVMALLVVAILLRSSRQSPTSEKLVIADKSRASSDRFDSFTAIKSADETHYAPAPRRTMLAGVAGMSGMVDQVQNAAVSAPMIARTAFLTIRVKDVEASRSSLDSILARHHGYPAQLNVTSPESGPRGFQASLRIPAAEFLSAVGEIKGLGRLESESQSGEDVARQHADIAARLKTARETEERFQAILQQRTGKISDVLEVERSIARVRGEIEAMEAEQKTLEHRVDFASVEVQLTEEYKAQMSLPDSVPTRIHNAFVAGYHNATESLLGFLLFFEEYGPALVVWLCLLSPVVLVWRRYKRVRSTL
jgi:anti-sigma factor RsiW